MGQLWDNWSFILGSMYSFFVLFTFVTVPFPVLIYFLEERQEGRRWRWRGYTKFPKDLSPPRMQVLFYNPPPTW
jgi:hypothetical protein